MCGLAATITINKNIDLAKLKLLSIFLRSRGKHSTGIFYNREITKDVEAYQSDFGDPLNFFAKHWFSTPKNPLKVSFVHNRFATRGERNKENAHPFEYDVNGVRHVFAHNGTIENIEELCAEYGLNFLDFKVDSKALGYIIAHYGFDVLSKYKGAAAFMYWRSDEPDSLYIWKGQSRQEADTEEIERPLYYAIKNNSVFVASESQAIVTAIDIDESKVISVPVNTIFRITGVEIQPMLEISRAHIQKKEKYYTHHFGGYGGAAWQTGDNFRYEKKTETQEKKNFGFNFPEPNICVGSDVYFNHGRYKRNGNHLSGKILITETGQVIPEDQATGVAHEVVYFFDGIPIRNEDAYAALIAVPETLETPAGVESVRNKKIPFFLYTSTGALYLFPEEADFKGSGKIVFNVNKYVKTKKKYIIDLSHNVYFPDRLEERSEEYLSAVNISDKAFADLDDADLIESLAKQPNQQTGVNIYGEDTNQNNLFYHD